MGGPTDPILLSRFPAAAIALLLAVSYVRTRHERGELRACVTAHLPNSLAVGFAGADSVARPCRLSRPHHVLSKPGRTFEEKSRPPEEQGTPCRMPLQAQYVTIKLNRYCSLLSVQACDPKENSHDRAQQRLTKRSCTGNLSLWKTSEHPGLDGLVRAGPPQTAVLELAGITTVL